METFDIYRGFGLHYQQVSGLTTVDDFGETVATFAGGGYLGGEKAAKEWVDRYLDKQQGEPPVITPYPMHEKLKSVQAEAQVQGDFIDWLCDQGIQLARWGDDDQLRLITGTTQDLLAQYHEIDQEVLEAEKRQMLDVLREATGQ